MSLLILLKGNYLKFKKLKKLLSPEKTTNLTYLDFRQAPVHQLRHAHVAL